MMVVTSSLTSHNAMQYIKFFLEFKKMGLVKIRVWFGD